jgi:gamma-butyrobetaine dioxygenase
MSQETTARVLDAGRRLRLSWREGKSRELSARWLLDHAEESREPVSGQRRHGALALDDARILEARVEDGSLIVGFPTGERRLPLAGLGAPEPAPARDLWLTPELIEACAPIPFADYLEDDAALARALRRVARGGLALLSGAGDDPDAVERAVARFGFVRETNYGRLFDVRIEPERGNFAYTERALDLHSDNPYREAPPTLQLLHAIQADAAGGGETLFVDGFAHAEALRREAPAAFDVLAREPARFSFTEASGARWQARTPVLVLSAGGALEAVRLNHRSLDLEPGDPDRLEAWYDAYLAFYRRLHAPGAAYARRLAPGEMVIFDNRRILHGRAAFDRGGARWLRGAYADVDGMTAALARLAGVKTGAQALATRRSRSA